MKVRTVIGLSGATAASLIGAAGLAATPAGAGGNGAINMPAANLSSYLGVPGVPLFAGFVYPGEPGAFVPPNVKVNGNCVDAAPWLFTDSFGLNFVSGNAVVYRVNGNTPLAPGFPGGLNAEGVAQLVDFSGPGDGQIYTGPAHVWLGQNGNAQGQVVGAQTVSFSGTAPDGSTISFTVNPGTTTAAHMNHQNGWGQQNLSCNIVPSS